MLFLLFTSSDAEAAAATSGVEVDAIDIDLFCLRPFSTTFKEFLKMFACTMTSLLYTYNTTYIATYVISKFSSAQISSRFLRCVNAFITITN